MRLYCFFQLFVANIKKLKSNEYLQLLVILTFDFEKINLLVL